MDLRGAAEELIELVREHDRRWNEIDLVGVAALWDTTHRAPLYLGDEYLLPIVGWTDLNKHWGRIDARIEHASLATHIVLVSVHDAAFGSVTALVDWALRTVESAETRSGRSWVNVLARRRPAGCRIVHYSETPIYAGHDFVPPAPRVSLLGGEPEDLAVEPESRS
jgi:hypothetical protein